MKVIVIYTSLILSCVVACDGTIDGTAGGVDATAAGGGDASAVTGEDGGPAADANPTAPDAIVQSGFCDIAGVLSVEAESYVSQTGYEAVSHGDASGGTAMQVGSNGSLDLEIHLSISGTYYLWIRALAPDAESNGLFVALDGVRITAPPSNPYAGVSDIFLNKSAVTWFWDPKWQGQGSGAVQGPVTFDATAGRHILSIQKRIIERPLIDKLVLTRTNEVPSGLGPGQTPCSGQ